MTLSVRSGLMPVWTQIEVPDVAVPYWHHTDDGQRRHIHELVVGATPALQRLVEEEHAKAIAAITAAAICAWHVGDGREARRLAHAAALLSQEIVGFWPASLNSM